MHLHTTARPQTKAIKDSVDILATLYLNHNRYAAGVCCPVTGKSSRYQVPQRDHQPSSPLPPADQQQQQQQKLVAGPGGGCCSWLWWWWWWASICRCCSCCQILPGKYLVPDKRFLRWRASLHRESDIPSLLLHNHGVDFMHSLQQIHVNKSDTLLSFFEAREGGIL